MRNRGYIAFVCLCWFGCSTADKQQDHAQFTWLSPDDTGVDFVNTNTETDQQNILTYEYFYNGGGVALGDINNDGLVDIYLTANQASNKLYLNKGNFRFEDITAKASVSVPSGWKTGVTMADVNGDGYLDIYVCRSGDQHPLFRTNILFINNGDLTFTDQAPAYGLDDDSYSTQALFNDFDRDGDLDMVLLNHSRLTISNSFDIRKRYGSDRVRYVGNQYYRHDGEKFKAVGDSVGLFGPASNYGLGVAAAYIDNDAWLDLYVTNDYTEKDKLLINQGSGFSEMSDSVLQCMSQFSMGVDFGDINNDGFEDFITLDMLPADNRRQKEFYWPNRYDVYWNMVNNGLHHQLMRNMLQLNNGDGSFTEIGQLAGVSNTDWSWAPLIADFDNDGWQDIFVTNGFKRNFTSNDFLRYQADLAMKAREGKATRPIQEILKDIPPNPAHNYLFKNKGDLTFADVSTDAGFESPSLTNGAAWADLDNDGDLDLVLNNIDQPAGIYRNNTNTRQYLKVKLQGNDRNTFGLGARVTVYVQSSASTRTMSPTRGFQSSAEPMLFFGLGASPSADSLRVQWPSGLTQTVTNVVAGQTLVLQERNGVREVNHPRPASQSTWIAQSALPYRYTENEFNDFNQQNLLYRMHSRQGPALAAADVNGDGATDFFVGGASGRAGVIFVQAGNTFRILPQQIFDSDAASEDVDAVFFDADGDGDQDLYVASGGSEFQADDAALQDRLYRNNGKGQFTKAILPEMKTSTGCVSVADWDGDGDIDIFAGGRIVPGAYPQAPRSYLLQNDGTGKFTIATADVCPDLSQPGMVTDAKWTDLNADGRQDLVVVGEWMPIKVFVNENGKLRDRSELYVPFPSEGWWNALHIADVNNDGRPDLIVGNEGFNSQVKVSAGQPATLYYADFDNNGSVDPLLEYYIGDKLYPGPTRDELTERLPSMKKKFPDYKSYADATMSDVLTAEQRQSAPTLKAVTFTTACLINEGDTFRSVPLPVEAQMLPVYAITTCDMNADGNVDLILGGNSTNTAPRFTNGLGNHGTVLVGDGAGHFSRVPATKSGFKVRGDVRALISFDNKIVVGLNNDKPWLITVKMTAP